MAAFNVLSAGASNDLGPVLSAGGCFNLGADLRFPDGAILLYIAAPGVDKTRSLLYHRFRGAGPAPIAERERTNDSST